MNPQQQAHQGLPQQKEYIPSHTKNQQNNPASKDRVQQYNNMIQEALPMRHGHSNKQQLLDFTSQMMDSIQEMSDHTTNNELEFSNSGREVPFSAN